MLQWFFKRNIDRAGGGKDVHLADVILFAIAKAGSAKMKRQSLWRALWQRSSGHAQAILAFCYAARRPGYGRLAFADGLGGEGRGNESAQQLSRLWIVFQSADCHSSGTYFCSFANMACSRAAAEGARPGRFAGHSSILMASGT
eukprot:g8744.t1